MQGNPELVRALSDAVTESGLSREEISTRLGHHKNWLGRILRGAIRNPKARDIEALEELLGADIRRTARIDVPVVRVPVVQEGSASLKGGVVIDYVWMPESLLPKSSEQHIVGVLARGACLEPVINDGDTALVDSSATAHSGDVIAVTIDGALHLKGYRVRGSHHYAVSNEGEVAIQPYQISGVVVGSFHPDPQFPIR